MSIKAMVWALQAKVGDAPAKLVLLGLASHAQDDGSASWPSKKALAEYAEVSTRTVVTKLQMLERLGLIVLGDQRITEYMRADRRPRVWDLVMQRGDNLTPRDDDYRRGEAVLSPRDAERGEAVLSPREEPRGEAPRSHGVKAVSHKTSLNLKEPTGSAGAPEPVDNSQTLVAEWINHVPGGRPPGRVVGQVAKEIDIMLREGIPYPDVRRGLALWQSKGLHPSALASTVHEARTANGRPVNGVPAPKPIRERVVCKTCWREQDVCRKTAAVTGDAHEWQPQEVRA